MALLGRIFVLRCVSVFESFLDVLISIVDSIGKLEMEKVLIELP